jgi:cadmium resistance protein CadD (predicted permease)
MKLHRFDALSFIFGVLIAAVGLVFLVMPDAGGIIDVVTDFGSWFWPTVFIAIGLGILAPLISRKSEGGETETD